MEWNNLYSKVPISTAVQTDLQDIRNAFHEQGVAGSIQIGKTTIAFRPQPSSDPLLMGEAGYGDPNMILLTPKAIASSNQDLMKTIIEENLHNGRIVGGYLGNGLEAGGAAVGQAAARQSEEGVVKGLTNDIYLRGQQAGWW
jgi:hypothetical protein